MDKRQNMEGLQASLIKGQIYKTTKENKFLDNVNLQKLKSKSSLNNHVQSTPLSLSRYSPRITNYDNFYLKINGYTKSSTGKEGFISKSTIYTIKDFPKTTKTESKIRVEGLLAKPTLFTMKKYQKSTYPTILLDDKYVNKGHALIDCTNGFHELQPFRVAFYEFLKITHKRKGNKVGRSMPKEIIRMIFDYIYEPRYFTITDIGSTLGTYIKIKFNEKYKIDTGNDIIMGTHIHAYMNKVVTNTNQANNKQLYYKYLLKEIIVHKSILVGISFDDQSVLESLLENREQILNDPEYQAIQFEKTYEFHMPYIKFSLASDDIMPDSTNMKLEPQTYIVFANQEISTIVVGRNVEMEVHLNHLSASRKHCRFIFEKGQWYITDGVENESSNGTWLGLKDYRLRGIKTESLPWKIYDGTEVKLGYSLLMFSFGKLNNN